MINNKASRFYLLRRSANKMSFFVQTFDHFVGRHNHRIKSADFEHVLFLTCWPIFLYTGEWTYFVLHRHGDCLQRQMNIYFSNLFCFLVDDIYFRSSGKMNLRSGVVHSWSWHHTKLQTILSAVCHDWTILSANFLGQLDRAYTSQPTLSIVWHPLYTIRLSHMVHLHGWASE